MKYLYLALITISAAGCSHNEFDPSPAQITQHKSLTRPVALNLADLPPAKKSYKKGEKLPDGSTAAADMKVVSDGH